MTDKQTKQPTKNGFQMHGLSRVSVSQMNKFREAPDAWACQYLGGAKFSVGWAAIQGFAVEAGIEWGVFNGVDTPECVEKAIEQLKERGTMLPNKAEEIEKRIPIVTQMVEQGLEQLMPLGKPDSPAPGERQHSIGIPVRFAPGDNGTIDLIGYLDFWYPQHNLVVDLKTTAKAPSKWSLSHGIQAAVYQKAVHAMTGEKPAVKFLYCLTRKKDPYIWLEMEDAEYYLASFKRTVTQLEKLLRLSNDSRDIIAALPHNPDSFYWSDAQEIAAQFYD